MSSLDAFNLDDMFAEGGDSLFGFDQDLMGGMDDIVDQERNQDVANVPLPASAPPPLMSPQSAPKRTGPRTKRTNPMVPEEEQEKLMKGRNKRKSKASAAYDEEVADLIEDGPRKKRKASMKKNQGGKADVDFTGANGTESKRSKKKKGATQVKLKAGFVPTVPAVGQFGARATSSKIKRKTKKGTSGGEDTTPSITALQGYQSSQIIRQIPKLEPTYCGLKPSKIMFYPFMESVPPEPNLKNKKVYPGFDKMSSTFTNTMVKPTDKLDEDEFVQGLNMGSPVFALITETFEAISDKERQAFNDDKREALFRTIPHMRKYIARYDRQKVVTDVYALLGLLGRQYNFLNTSLENMQAWCRTEFSPQDYTATYETNEESRASKHRRWKHPVVKVHVVCPGHRESGPLMALMPPSTVIIHTPPATVKPQAAVSVAPVGPGSGATSGANATSSGSGSTSTKKKSKAKPGTTTSSTPVPTKPKTYAECSPHERRSRIAERVTKIASELQDRHRQQQLKKESGPKKPFTFTEDETLSTQRMWDFMENKGFHKIASSSLSSLESLHVKPNKVLMSDPARIRGSRWDKQYQQLHQQQIHPPQQQHLQQPNSLPQHAGQDAAYTPLPGPGAERGSEAMEEKEKEEGDEKFRISSNSLFDRLQSLLVEEDDDEHDIQETDSDSYDDSSSSGDDESLGFLDETDEDEDITDPKQASNLPVVDLSNLSLEERAFIHLSKMGLIGSSVYPKAHLVQSSAEEHSDEHDFCNVIGSMAEDLSDITAKNNARVQFLESAVIRMDLSNAKQLEDQQNSLINKCQNLIKRNKEKSKKNSNKKKDDLNLPW